MVNRCKTCNLPSDYPGISFDSNNVCNFCHETHEKVIYPGVDVLKEKINAILATSDKDRKYDCVVGLSGGRDSSYLLYVAKKVLNLNVLALCIKNDFMTTEAKNNVVNITKGLGVDLVYLVNDELNVAARKCIKAWAKKPDAGMTATFCTGCRHGIRMNIPKYAKEHHIPIILVGDVPYEKMDYRMDLLCDGKKPTNLNKIIGYAKRALRNPSYLSTVYNQYQDFISLQSHTKEGELPTRIRPFFFFEWKEKEVMEKISEYGWDYDHDFHTTWRSDCYINLIRQFIYKKMVGFNDQDVYYSQFVRDGEMSLEDAIKNIEESSQYNEDKIRDVFKKFFDIDYDKIKDKIVPQK